MKKSVMAGVFGAGLAAVGWVAWGFVGSSPLALVMTVLMGGVYVLGAAELMRFRAATASLAAALADMAQPLTDLGAWLERLPPPLRGPVRQRIEGARMALPGPALAPYLVGLLVMLGMLGTFLGMVVTFKGAVLALEVSANLEAVRAALAAPIKGLGLSFGTSVAGVATSAMLGLLLALCRRERLEALRLLDVRIATVLRPFSPAHRRDEMFHALQAQAQALPLIAQHLQGLMDGLERRHGQLNDQLLKRQQAFHQEAASAYTQLASAVGASLQGSLEAGTRQAGEVIRPVVEQAMHTLAQEARNSHAQLREVTGAQMQTLSGQWEGTARQVADTWLTALHGQEQAQQAQAARFDAALEAAEQAFEQRSGALQAALHETVTQAHAAQAAADQQRLAEWSRSMQDMARMLAAQWQQAGVQAVEQQQRVCLSMEEATARITERMDEQAQQALGGAARLLDQTDALMRTRMETEAQWVQAQGQRMDQLAHVWRTELGALRDEEAARAQAAVERLDVLQAAVAGHLATLGAALEAPLTRLLQTASDVPQAAAEVIAQLRQEMTRLGERDNIALAERTAMMEQLGSLLHSVNEAAVQQRAAIESLVHSAASVLEQAGQQFAQSLQAQAGTVDGVAAHVAASAVELSSLGESFGHGVGLFSASSEKLTESLQRIEAALGQSLSRSDEQLAYYVAQAREVIDLSISAQQGIVEDLRRMNSRAAAGAQEVAA
ncbi:MAG: DUF802 domain-containing protein [Burkholderiaceae bacterium]|nr:DUF802 domain-containing protein [Burkholderiaceae bacterium]